MVDNIVSKEEPWRHDWCSMDRNVKVFGRERRI